MAKLPRSTQKIFAESATNNGVFGSLQAGTKQYSNDIATIQSLGAYAQGWNAATISSEKLPPLEEFQSLQYMMTSQLAYIFQQGVPEWDSGTTYYQGSMVKVIGTNGDYALYASLTNDNIGNQVTDDVNWKLVYNTADPMQLVSNMEQTLTQSTTKYPSSKAVYDAFSTINPDLYLQYNRVARGILTAPSKPTYSGMQITIPSGIVIEVPNGFKSDGSLNYTDSTTQSNTFDIDTSVIGTSGTGLFFYNTTSNTGGSILKSAYYDGYTQPSSVSAQYAVWYDRSTNFYKFTSDTGSSWSQVNVCLMGEFTISSSAVTSFTPYNNLSLLLENDLSAAESRIISIMNNKADKDLSNVSANIDYVIKSGVTNGITWEKYRSGRLKQRGFLTVDNTSVTTGSFSYPRLFTLPKAYANKNYGVLMTLMEGSSTVGFQVRDTRAQVVDETSFKLNIDINVIKWYFESDGMGA